MSETLCASNAIKPEPPQTGLGLYVHIPFCLKKCHYCDFVITTKRDAKTQQRFFDCLRLEIQQATQKYGRLKFGTFYLGGGTPSALTAHAFQKLIEIIFENFDFDFGFEFTVEVNPGDVNKEKIEAYRQSKVNRVSLGVQSFQEKLLQDMNRPHGISEIKNTAEFLHDAGISNLSCDVILNLPGQSMIDMEETIKKVLELKPKQVSVYDLDVHEKTVYGRRQREGILKLADEKQYAEMAEMTAQRLEDAGLLQYELSNFAKPGYESKHNLIYWRNQPYLGLGPGAFSYMNGERYQFAESVESYFKKASSGDWTNHAHDVLTPREVEKETFLTGIRLRDGIDLRRVSLLAPEFEGVARRGLEEGFLEKDGFRLKFTPRGRLVAEVFLRQFAQV